MSLLTFPRLGFFSLKLHDSMFFVVSNLFFSFFNVSGNNLWCGPTDSYAKISDIFVG